MNRHLLAVLAGLGLATALPAAAWSHGQPGLWAVTNQIDFSKGGPNIPPETIARLRLLGAVLPFGEPMTSEVCVSPQQAAAEQPPGPPERDPNCHIQNLSKQGLTYSGDLVCNGETKGRGHFESTYVDDQRYDGSLSFAGFSKLQGEVATTDTYSGKWLSADCGAVKPYAD